MEMQVQRILDEIKSTSVQTFEKNLVGIYVHGSLALGCFSWDNSDIDFIVVLKNLPTQAQKEEYISELMRINEICPPKGLEMSIVLDEYTSQFIYPTPFELHFSNSHLRQCTENISEYCMQMNGTDKDLASATTWLFVTIKILPSFLPMMIPEPTPSDSLLCVCPNQLWLVVSNFPVIDTIDGITFFDTPERSLLLVLELLLVVFVVASCVAPFPMPALLNPYVTP